MKKVPTAKPRSLVFSLFSIILMVSALAVPGAGEVGYDIEARLDDDKHVLTADQQVSFTNPLGETVEEVVFKLDGNFLKEPNPYMSKINQDSSYPAGFDPGWTKIKKVTGPDGEQLSYETESRPPNNQTFSLEKTTMRVQLEEELPPGEETTINVEFSTKFPHRKTGDEEVYRDVYTWRFGWHPTLAPAEWWEGYDEESYSQIVMEKADYHVELDVPEGFAVGGNVISRSEVGQGNGREIVKLDLPSARSFPLVMSENYRVLKEDFKEFTVEVLYRPGYEEGARLLSSYANEILKFYSERFGGYPREQLSFAQSPRSGYFGMAADGLIVLGDSFFSEKELALSTITNRLSEYLIAHEIAHQWFGIGVGADLHSQNWISEAFAEFLSLRYFHSKYPEEEPNLFRFERDGFVRNAIESQLGYVNLRQHTFELPYMENYHNGFDEAVIKPRQEVKYANATQTRIYKKGYLILRTLEGIIGEEKMEEFIKKVHRERGNEVVDVETLANDVRELSGDEIPEEFFREWLFSSDYVDYGIENISAEKGSDGEYVNEITLTKEGSLTVPVDLRATLSSGDTVSRRVTLESGRKKVTLVEPEKVKKATVDPDSEVMDTNRLNNHYPRKVEVSFGENRLPLDAYFIMVGAGTVAGRTPNEYAWAIGPGSVQGKWNPNRNLTASGGFSVSGEKLTDLDFGGWLEGNFDFWSTPATGYAGSYRAQDRSLDLRLERFQDNSGRTFNLLGLGGTVSETVAENRKLSFQSAFSLSGDTKLSLSAEETERFLPGIYLDLSASVGLSPGDLPDVLKFDLPELKSYGKRPEGATSPFNWKRYSYPGNYKLFSKVSLGFPLQKDEKYYLGSLALVTDVRQDFFLSAGDTWDTLEGVGPDTVKYEGGTELSVKGKTLGGLIPFDLAIGYAYHGQDKGRPYFNFSLGL